MANPIHQKYVQDVWTQFHAGTLTNDVGQLVTDSEEVIQMCDTHRRALSITTFDAAAPTTCVPGTITRIMRYADGSEEVIDVIKPVAGVAPGKIRAVGTPSPTLDDYRRMFDAGQLPGVSGVIATDINDLAADHPLRVDYQRKKNLREAARLEVIQRVQRLTTIKDVAPVVRKRKYVDKRSKRAW